MAANPKARIEITHSARGLQTVTKTWSALGWEWFGPNHPELPRIFNELKTKGEAKYTDGSGTFSFKALDPMEAPCPICGGFGWVCESHPNKVWTEEGCKCDAGMPCQCSEGGKS